MWLKNFLGFLTSTSTRRPPIRRRRLGSWTGFEALEDRCMLSAFSIVPIPLAPQDVNNNGLVVGNSAGGGDLWQNGELIDLGPVVPYAINDAGQVVGVSAGAFLITPEDFNGDGTPDQWYRDDNQDGVNDLMTALPGSIAYDINSSGQVIGFSDSEGHGFLWQNGELIDLGPVVPYAIDDAGQVVGTNSSGFNFLLSPEDTNGDGTPDLWYRDANNDGVNDLMVTLGQWGLQYAHASAINAGGQVIGMDGYFSILWTPSEPNGSSGSMEYLGSYSGGVITFDPSDVNASGRVIGNYGWSVAGEEGGSAGSVAQLWENGEIYNPADLLPADSGLSELYSADAISDSGWIAGTMTYTAPYGVWIANWYVMIPTGEDIPPYIRIGDAAVTEGNSGTVSATFTVNLSKPSSQTVTVSYNTADYYSDASAGSDYQVTSGSLTLAPGQTSMTITVPVIGDRLDERDERFSVNLSNPTNAIIADGQGVGSILNDDPQISISEVTKKEGNGKRTTLFTFTVTLSAAYDQPVTMLYRTADGTATTSDGDYVAKTGTLTFGPGETTKTITIVVNSDSKKETNEYFYLELFDNSNSLLTWSGIGWILNDDGSPR